MEDNILAKTLQTLTDYQSAFEAGCILTTTEILQFESLATVSVSFQGFPCHTQTQAILEAKERHGEQHRKRVCELRASRRYGRYLRLTRAGRPRIGRAKVKAARRAAPGDG